MFIVGVFLLASGLCLLAHTIFVFAKDPTTRGSIWANCKGDFMFFGAWIFVGLALMWAGSYLH